jgi:hypothetical protein
MAKNARAAMKAKATRMGGKGDPKAKVDASSWSPPEMMNTGAKVGMRPLSRRAFRKGGKVIEKCEGGPAAMRADRKQRKAGGRATSLVTDMINRNVKKANKYREGGDAHVGGYKSGGDVEQDKKLVKKAFRQHDEHMHGGKHEDIKLKKGGRTKKQVGGGMTAGESAAMNRRINDTLDDGRTLKEDTSVYRDARRAPRELSPPFIRDRTDRSDPRALRDLERGGYDAMIGVNPRESGMKKGGRTKKADGGKADLPPNPPSANNDRPRYSEAAVNKSIESSNRSGRKISSKEAAQIHRLLRGRQSGGKAIPGDAPTRGYTRDGSATDAPPPKYENIDALIKDKGLAKKNGGGTYYGGTRPTGGRMPRKAGGRAKGKTNISITINPQQPQDQQQQAMMPKMPTPPPMPPPPIAPPGMGPGMPPMPMPMPPPGPPPGLAGGPPPGMPPMPRKRGGRAYRSYKDMDAGALGGMGRLEKVEIEHGKRVGRLSGGRARSYKDMDAGSLGGMGRIEKIAIQKHKR